jgi:hypothetical protein
VIIDQGASGIERQHRSSRHFRLEGEAGLEPRSRCPKHSGGSEKADLLGRYSNPSPELLLLLQELDLIRENNHNQDVRSKPSDRS